jgi:hypothetical protein
VNRSDFIAKLRTNTGVELDLFGAHGANGKQ